MKRLLKTALGIAVAGGTLAASAAFAETGGAVSAIDNVQSAAASRLDKVAQSESQALPVVPAAIAPYCANTYTSGIEPITLVKINEINNPSPATSSTAHEDFTATAGTLRPGGTYAVTMKSNTGGNFTHGHALYVDWNGDGQLTGADEGYWIGAITNSTGVDALSVTAYITVPITATPGTTRLRAMTLFNATALSGLPPCRTGSGFGQSEDYTVTIDPAAVVPTLPLTATASFTPASGAVPTNTTLAITVGNINAAPTPITADFTTTLPAGMTLAANATTTCPGTFTGAAGGSAITLASGASIPAGGCAISASVAVTAGGNYAVTAGPITTAEGSASAVAKFFGWNNSASTSYNVGFEAPDYTAGAINAQQGWSARTSNVATTTPATGAQHFSQAGLASPTTSNNPLAISPQFVVGTTRYAAVSANLRISRTTNGASWQFQPQDPDAGLLTTIVLFNRTGNAIQTYSWSGGSGTAVSTGATFTADTYFNFKLLIDRATSNVRLCKDGVQIFESTDGTGTTGGNNVSNMVFQQATGSGQTANNTFFADDLNISYTPSYNCDGSMPAHTVTPSVTGNGTITPSTPQTVNDGATTTFTLAATAGNHLVDVTGTCGGTLAGTSFTTAPVTTDCTVIANFAADVVTRTVTPSVGSGTGTITPSTPQTVNQGATTSFTLAAGSGFSNGTVGGTCGGTLAGNVYTTNAVNADCTVIANFVPTPINGPYHSPLLNHAVPNTTGGTSLNLVTGAFDDTGPTASGTPWDLNFWGSGGALRLWGVGTYSVKFVISGTTAAVLPPGTVIGPSSTYSGTNGTVTPAAAWLAGTDGALGFQFKCDGRLTNPVASPGICYGYARVKTTGPNGFPATVLEYWYDGDGQPITVQPFVSDLPPTVAKAFAPASVAVATNSVATITLNNANATVATLTADLVDTLPAGLVASSATTTCGGTASFTAGTIKLASGATIPASGSCTISANVQSATIGSYVNTIAAGALQTNKGNNAAAASATLAVTDGTDPNLVCASPNHNMVATFDGSSINWITGVIDDVGNQIHWNPYDSGPPTGLSFFWPSTGGGGGVASGSVYSVLAPGATIGSSSTFIALTAQAATANWRAGADGYMGFKLTCPGGTCYGYANLKSTAPTGFPLTLKSYCYNKLAGTSITIPVATTHTVTPSVGSGSGTISPNTPQTVNHGATATFTLAAAAGSHIDTVGGTCGGTLSGNSYTTNAVNNDCTVVANFAADVGSPTISVTPASVSGSVAAGSSTTAPLTIGNTGTGSLTWTIATAPASSGLPTGQPPEVPVTHPNADIAQLKQAPRSAASQNAVAALPAAAGTAYAVINNVNDYVSLDPATPGTMTHIGVASGSVASMWGGGFLNGDTSVHYLLGDTGLKKFTAATRTVTTINASTGAGDVWAATIDPTSGKMYYVGPSSAQKLFSVDLTTGTATQVGSITGSASGHIINGLAADATGKLWATDKTNDTLVAIDKTTGASTLVGSLGIDTEFVASLAFGGDGVLYFAAPLAGGGSNNMYSVNTGTGATTLIGALTDQIEAMAFGGSGPPPPCQNPANVPWLSVTPASGSITGGASTPVTVSLNASALSAGTYTANLCVNSNDAAHALVVVPVSFTVTPGTGQNGIIYSAALNHDIAATLAGTSLNIVSSAMDDAGPVSGNWDFNFFSSSSKLTLWKINSTNGGQYAVDGSGKARLFQPGEQVDSSTTFSSGVSASVAMADAWLAGTTDGYLGVKFNCNGRLTFPVAAPGVCYGYVHLKTTGPNGFPATILDTAFNGDGGAMPIGPTNGSPTVAKAFSPSTVTTGSPSTATIKLTNPNPTAATLTAALVDTLPTGLVASAATTTCGGTVSFTAGSVTLASGATIPASGSCTISATVSAAAEGSYVNTIAAGALKTDKGNNATAASATLTVSNAFPLPYCNVMFPSDVEPITRVKFRGIDNSSPAAVNGSPALENFLSVAGGVVSRGVSYTIAVEGNTAGNFTTKVKAYIDWNRNGVFDADEGYVIGDIANSTGTDGKQAVAQILVPATAQLGQTRMRVIKKFSSAPDACNTSGFGQAEDYTLTVNADPPAQPDASITPVTHTFTAEQGASATGTMTISNGADALLTFSIRRALAERTAAIEAAREPATKASDERMQRAINDAAKSGVTMSLERNLAVAGKPVVPRPFELLATQIAQMANNTPEALNGVACGSSAAGTTSENSWWRRFYFNEHDVGASVQINAVTIASETGPTIPVTVKVYTIPHSVAVNTIPTAQLALIGSGTGTVGGDLTTSTIAISDGAVVDDTSALDLVVEYKIAGSSSGQFFPGGNSSAETHPTFLSAPDCGLSAPATASSLGFPSFHLIMVVDVEDIGGGGVGCDAPTNVAWLSTNPTNGSIDGIGSMNVAVKANAAGLAVGTHTAQLCVNTNDPAHPRFEIPVTFNVTPPAPLDPIFKDGFDGAPTSPEIVASGPINHAVQNNIDGTSVNWITGDIQDADVANYHFNPYNNSVQLTFWWNTGAPNIAGVSASATTSDFLVLQSGAVIGPASTWSTTNNPGPTAWAAGADGYLGFRFNCSSLPSPPASGICYGYVHLKTTAPAGFPATIVDYAYNKAGSPITVP